MAKYPKFLEADNPNQPDGETFIIHTQRPRFIAQVLISDDEKKTIVYQRYFNVGGKTDYKGYSAIIGVVDFWDQPKSTGDPQKDADDLAKLMRRCADWYHGILKSIVESYEKEN